MARNLFDAIVLLGGLSEELAETRAGLLQPTRSMMLLLARSYARSDAWVKSGIRSPCSTGVREALR